MPREGLTEPHSRPSGSLCSPQLTRPSPQHRPAAALPAAQAEVPACSGAPKAPLPQRCLSSPSSPSASPPPSLPFPIPFNSLLRRRGSGSLSPGHLLCRQPRFLCRGKNKGTLAGSQVALGGPALLLPALRLPAPALLPPQPRGPAAPCPIAAAGGGSLGLISCPPLCFWGWEGEGQCRDLPPAGPFLAAESDKLGLGVVL